MPAYASDQAWGHRHPSDRQPQAVAMAQGDTLLEAPGAAGTKEDVDGTLRAMNRSGETSGEAEDQLSTLFEALVVSKVFAFDLCEMKYWLQAANEYD